MVQFKADVKVAIALGFLRAGNVLVLDNVAYHCGKENKHLAEWRWRFFGIQILFLPTRTPEWNPIELVWQNLVQELKHTPLSVVRAKCKEEGSKDIAAKMSQDILDGFSHARIWSFYRRCFKGILFDD